MPATSTVLEDISPRYFKSSFCSPRPSSASTIGRIGRLYGPQYLPLNIFSLPPHKNPASIFLLWQDNTITYDRWSFGGHECLQPAPPNLWSFTLLHDDDNFMPPFASPRVYIDTFYLNAVQPSPLLVGQLGHRVHSPWKMVTALFEEVGRGFQGWW
ncbi:hypothetical protein GALMADRAFT_145891 [Galerina marginata CBS 339.88]|uniref:Uncharacterized protein n=1 Tax=Galerina marginata (strain CBS 339.88) TaxID=685588 RepID=A0A067SD85_GALM3|nr:hypothetical protein GALMADRAFT_145891 [Galerina marginata CBS 339.88]